MMKNRIKWEKITRLRPADFSMGKAYLPGVSQGWPEACQKRGMMLFIYQELFLYIQGMTEDQFLSERPENGNLNAALPTEDPLTDQPG
jgi:hypothetical protein